MTQQPQPQLGPPAMPSPEELLAQLEEMVDARVARALRDEGFEVQTPVLTDQRFDPHGLGQMVSPTDALKEILEAVDPADSEASMTMYAWLTRHHRLQRIGTLEQGGHLFVYLEPEGTTKEGYVAGGSQGDRAVDKALKHAEDTSGGASTKKGMCRNCLSLVEQAGDGKPYAGGDPSDTVCPKNSGGPHDLAEAKR